MKRKYTQEEIDQCRIGRIYCNKNDLNIFVKRRGIGAWTMNLGNKWSWVIMGVELLIVLFIVLLVF